MRKSAFISAGLLAGIVALVLTVTPARSKDAGPALGTPLPDFDLPVPQDGIHREYLDLESTRQLFRIDDIKSDAVIIEIFSMYCPFCQREAPRVNKLYDLIQSDPQSRDRIKMIGIGVGNSAFEVDYFRKSYNIQFPLFPDEDFKIHKQLGQVRTPFFIGVKIEPGGKPLVMLTHLGGFSSPEDFLKQVMKSCGLGGGK